MTRFLRSAFLVLYYGLASRLPSSFVPGGSIFNLLRVLLLRRVLPVGQNTKIQPHVYIGSGRNISIGEKCEINERVRIIDSKIGNFVMIAPYVNLLGGKTHPYDDTTKPMILQNDEYRGPIIVEDDVWIGINVVIMPGLKIGRGSVIGANAVVTKDIPPFSVAGGVPAQVIKTRSSESL